MIKFIRSLLTPPVFTEDERNNRRARDAYFIALAFLLLVPLYLIWTRILVPTQGLDAATVIFTGLGVIALLTIRFIRLGRVRLASGLLVAGIWLGVNGLAASGFGLRDSSFIINFLVMLIAALLLGWWATLVAAVGSILSAYGLASAEAAGLIVPPPYAITYFAFDISVLLGLGAFFIRLLITSLEQAIGRASQRLEAIHAANLQLQTAQADLEARRTELLTSNQMLQERTERLRAIAEVARTGSTIQNLEQLLPQLAAIVSQQLGYYHVGIFLLDEARQFAILRAANTRGGQQMLASGYRLRIGEQGIVGFVARSGTPRVAADVQQDAAFFNAPELPDTRSELALPLLTGGATLGVLDLQSNQRQAFTEEDVPVLSILADLIAVAIRNALSVEQMQRALLEAESATQQLTGQAWSGYLGEPGHRKGFRFDGVKPEPLRPGVTADGDGLTIPVQLRGQAIGRLKIKSTEGQHAWTEDERAILEATAERVAIALESARLLEEAQKRAAREAFLSDVGTKLGTSFQLDSIMRDTVEELGQTLRGSTVSFQLVNPSTPPAPEPPHGRNGTSD